MAFAKGAKAIAKSEEQEKAARKAAYASDRLDHLKIEDGDTVYIRLLTPVEPETEDGPGWIKVAQHNFVKTKAAPKDAKSWPKGMSAICRYDKQLPEFQDCYICDNNLQVANRNEFAKPSQRVWALAAVRHQIRGDGSEKLGGEALRGKMLGYANTLEEYEILGDDDKPSGKKAERLKIVILNFTWKQLFAMLAHAEENYEGGALGRDFKITRTGSGTDTEYIVLAMDPTSNKDGEVLRPGSSGWKQYTDELARRKIDLDEIVMKQASDEWYARWFDPTKQVDKDGKIVSSGATVSETSAEVFTGQFPPAPDDEEPKDAATQQKLAELRAKLGG